jgi:hypothetical protein
MPNWCNNTLTITGKAKDLNKLMKQVEITKSEATSDHYETSFSCHKVIPQPIGVDWYSWNIENWGTKWDLNEVVKEDSKWEEGTLIYYFSTAWSPVTQVIERLAKEHKKLLFTYSYWEGGSDFWGEHEYQKGKEVSEEGGSLSEAGCERLEYLMGEHHQCKECWSAVECAGDNTPNLCDECLQNSELKEEELWEGEVNEGKTQQSVEVA